MLKLPIGYRFCPSDEDLITHYLARKVAGESLPAEGIMKECNVYSESVLSDIFRSTVKEEEKMYFFTQLEKKTKNSSKRVARKVGNLGTWHEISGEEILNEQGRVIGMKRSYDYKEKGSVEDRAWNMKQYSLAGDSMVLVDEKSKDYVLCVVKKKSRGGQTKAGGRMHAREDNNVQQHQMEQQQQQQQQQQQRLEETLPNKMGDDDYSMNKRIRLTTMETNTMATQQPHSEDDVWTADDEDQLRNVLYGDDGLTASAPPPPPPPQRANQLLWTAAEEEDKGRDNLHDDAWDEILALASASSVTAPLTLEEEVGGASMWGGNNEVGIIEQQQPNISQDPAQESTMPKVMGSENRIPSLGSEQLYAIGGYEDGVIDKRSWAGLFAADLLRGQQLPLKEESDLLILTDGF